MNPNPDQGQYVGRCTPSVMSTTILRAEVEREAQAVGSDGSFFMLNEDDEGNTPD